MVTASQLDLPVDLRTSESLMIRGLTERDIKHSSILIVDDESLNIEVVRRYLEIGGYRNLHRSCRAGLATDRAEPSRRRTAGYPYA